MTTVNFKILVILLSFFFKTNIQNHSNKRLPPLSTKRQKLISDSEMLPMFFKLIEGDQWQSCGGHIGQFYRK